jgi:hypothetical protein
MSIASNSLTRSDKRYVFVHHNRKHLIRIKNSEVLHDNKWTVKEIRGAKDRWNAVPVLAGGFI